MGRYTALNLLVFVILLVGCGYEPIDGPRRFDPAGEPTLVPTSQAVAKPVYEVQQGEVVQELEFAARVSPRLETPVLAPNRGRILLLDVQAGDLVTAGERIAQYDFSEIEEELGSLQAAIDENNAELAQRTKDVETEILRAELELEIAQLNLNLAQDGEVAASDSEFRLLELEVELAQNKLDSLGQAIDPNGEIAAENAELETLITNLQFRLDLPGIITPIDGVVLGISIQRGSFVEEEQTVALIGQMGSLEDVSVSANLRSDQLELLTHGMSADLVFFSDSETSYPAQIASLPYPYNSGGADLGFDPADGALRLLPDDPELLDQFAIGELVQVQLVLDAKDDAIWLPAKAIREFSGRTFVVVKEGEREQRIDVEVGLSGNGRIEILGDVEAGDQVIGP